MTLSASIAQSLSDNALEDALDEVKAHLKAKPSDQEARHLYIDLLVLSGDYERADNQCSLAATLSPDATMGFALLRNELRAMAARDAWFASGALPEFPQGPSELDKLAVRLGIAHRDGNADEARAALNALDELRGERPLIWNGRPVSDFRDLDDRTPHALEVIMTGGGYLWIDFAKIAALSIEPIARPRDLAFRRAELSLNDGAAASVLLPAVYHGTGKDATLRLGRETDWVDEATGITTGRGQRCFLAGDELVSFHDTRNLEIVPASSAGRQVAHG
ncbi:protein of avirulence locus involved in temperature-dependent protein secretion [Rhizobium leguminosarum bv. trifolii WSM2297]|uniref:Protein of avirulence locus involved in temperature-dependent protein secretion n=1 Tax=Rhizobium leguminosarum bv. trifolii WSM2297 TaxID=754762 RepID=J0KZY4_RHILT|nr:type VI secretion system accessory protein TagJ [Rhizobium leguminosarum]EJC83419.1 protein of avirulence locus involved in temperature-dependent protein secretion [Rhizobium leguminosarum bv. trifolii WSM2297]EJC84989.1 protein of avirulence locus involved in temperature-dependent protein secretion [Rhizobium leguminosarum bv. trifolii WSM2297]